MYQSCRGWDQKRFLIPGIAGLSDVYSGQPSPGTEQESTQQWGTAVAHVLQGVSTVLLHA